MSILQSGYSNYRCNTIIAGIFFINKKANFCLSGKYIHQAKQLVNFSVKNFTVNQHFTKPLKKILPFFFGNQIQTGLPSPS